MGFGYPHLRAAARFAGLLVALALWAGCGASSVETRTVPGQPGLQYEARGHFLYLQCRGDGSPTVVLEAGLGETHEDWSLVEPPLAATTRVCSYDRGGLGSSRIAPGRATAKAKADDLHALLRAARVEPPYVLVGHSFGGLLVRVYTNAYPKDVSGVVLVDASHPDQTQRFRASLPLPRTKESPVLTALRDSVSDISSNPEGVDWSASTAETRAAGTLGERPLVVVTAGVHEWAPQGMGLDAVSARLDRTWSRLQDELARLSTDVLHVVAVRSPHFVMGSVGQPELVVRGIQADVEAARTGDRLPPCRRLFSPPGARCPGSP